VGSINYAGGGLHKDPETRRKLVMRSVTTRSIASVAQGRSGSPTSPSPEIQDKNEYILSTE
jgi:hypothetical protein